MNNNSSKQILLSVIGVAILVIAVVGVSFAFFSYVYNGGTANEVQTGTIIFKASDSAVQMENVFPTDDYNAKVATVSVSGATTYAEGVDFVVRVGSLNNRGKNITNGPADWNHEDKGQKTIVPTIKVDFMQVNGITFDYTYEGNGSDLDEGTILCSGTIAEDTDIDTLTKIIEIRAYYDQKLYHISENTRTQLGSLLPTYFDTTNGIIVHPETWNSLTGTGSNAAFSFTIDVLATQGGSGRLPSVPTGN